MVPLTIKGLIINNSYWLYFILINIDILLNSIIEVISSCFLTYLTPPGWKFAHINAGALPLYLMTFGKFCGCLIGFAYSSGNSLLNHYIITSLTVIGYCPIAIYIMLSPNFRVKSIA